MKKLSIVMIGIMMVMAMLSSCGAGAVSKSGVVTEASKNKLAISATDGTVYEYSVDEKTVFTGTDSLGDTVEVTSKKEYTAGIHADAVKLLKSSEAVSNAVLPLYGIIEEYTDTQIKVQANNESVYTVQLNDQTVISPAETSLKAGDYVEIVYEGGLDEQTALAVHVIVISEEQSKAAPHPAASPGKTEPKPTAEPVKYFSGECVDMTMHAVVVAYQNSEYTILKDDNTQVEDRIGIGDTIRIYHRGTLSDGMIATRIALLSRKAAPPQATPTAAPATEKPASVPAEKQPEPASPTTAPAPQATAAPAEADNQAKKMKGEITDAGNAHIAIRVENGDIVNFLKDDDTAVKTDISIGSVVEVTYTEDGEYRTASEINKPEQ